MKNIVKIIAFVLIFSVLFVGCGKDKNENLVTIGEYKGFKVTEFDTTVTEEDVNNAISQFLSENKYKVDVTDRGAEKGDIVVIDFEGIVDGVAFQGGTATDYEISALCSGGFIEGFEEAILEKKVGDSFSADLKFPDEYPNNPDLAGKPVTFNYTLKGIKQTIVPEYNDETVEQYAGYATTAEYEEHLKSYLKTQKQTLGEENQSSELWTQLFEVCEVIEYPQDKIDAQVKDMKAYFEMYAEMFQVSYADFIATYTSLGTEAEAEKYMLEEAQMIVKGSLIIDAMVEEHNLTYTESEYNAFVNNYASANGMTPEEVTTSFPEEEIAEAVYYEKVIEFLRQYAEVVPATQE